MCKICNHPDREVIEASIRSGEVSEASIAQLAGCSQPTVNRHKRSHMALSTAVLKEELNAVETVEALPEDLLVYGLLKVINALERLEIKSKSGSYKSEEAIATLTNSLLNFEKRYTERQQSQKGLGTFRYEVVCVEPEDLTMN